MTAGLLNASEAVMNRPWCRHVLHCGQTACSRASRRRNSLLLCASHMAVQLNRRALLPCLVHYVQ